MPDRPWHDVVVDVKPGNRITYQRHKRALKREKLSIADMMGGDGW